MQGEKKHPAPEVQAPGRDKDGFPIKELEAIKRLGARRVESPQGVYYTIPMRALYPDNPNMTELDRMNFFPTEEAAQDAAFRALGALACLAEDQGSIL